nr:MAG: RNA-dependent RNA polymerase [Wufeng shrew nodavirus 6]
MISLFNDNARVKDVLPPVYPRRNVIIQIIRDVYLLLYICGWYICSLFRRMDIRKHSILLSNHRHLYPDYRSILVHHIKSIPLFRFAADHTHRESASLRTSTSTAIVATVQASGFRPYMVSASASDTRADLAGCRYFYMVKDLQIEFKNDNICDDDVLVFIDVDYYADMNAWLKLGKPIVMFTLVPEHVNYQGADYSYVVKNNHVIYSIKGGGSYCHRIWNYDHDVISIIDDDRNLICYNVTQKKLAGDANRRIICLTPYAKIEAPYYYYMEYKNGITYKDYMTDDVVFVYDPVARLVSIGPNGGDYFVTLPVGLFHAIRIRLSSKTTTPQMSDVERMLDKAKIDDAYLKAAYLFEMMSNKVFKPNVISTVGLPTNFQPVTPLVTEDSDEPGQLLGSPLVTSPALFPARGVNSDTACITGRVDKPKNDVMPPVKFRKYARDFVELLVPLPGIGKPMEAAEVIAIQNRATQQARSRQAAPTMSSSSVWNRLVSFIKVEPYAATNEPRNITTCSPELTIQMSRFTLSEKKDLLLDRSWFGPGKTPLEVCRRLQEISHYHQNGVVLTDYTRMDGSCSSFVQNQVVKASSLRWCNPDDRVAYDNCYKAVFTRTAVTSTGHRYDPYWGTRSGSPITSDGNTKITAYISYCALREIGYSRNEAWKMLNEVSLRCGDDGVDAAIPGMSDALEYVSKALGFKVKCQVVSADGPISYCGRVFTDIKYSFTSVQDVPRTLVKLHLSANKGVTKEQAAVNKAMGYLITDPNTPLISDWCSLVTRLHGTTIKGMMPEETWKLSQPWPQDNLSTIDSYVCKALDITPLELELRRFSIQQATSLDDVPVVWNNVVEHRIPAVVGGQLVGTTPRVEDTEINRAQCQLPVKVCDYQGQRAQNRLPLPHRSRAILNALPSRQIKNNSSKLMNTGQPQSSQPISSAAPETFFARGRPLSRKVLRYRERAPRRLIPPSQS